MAREGSKNKEALRKKLKKIFFVERDREQGINLDIPKECMKVEMH
jgi:hypothetical protein